MAISARARFLAPVALGVVVIATIVVVAAGSNEGSRPALDRPAQNVQRPAPRPMPRTYRVREGDSLLEIANRTGVPLERLRELNPRLDPQALQPGQRLKLRR